jgi:hypothetical protein
MQPDKVLPTRASSASRVSASFGFIDISGRRMRRRPGATPQPARGLAARV